MIGVGVEAMGSSIGALNRFLEALDFAAVVTRGLLSPLGVSPALQLAFGVGGWSVLGLRAFAAFVFGAALRFALAFDLASGSPFLKSDRSLHCSACISKGIFETASCCEGTSGSLAPAVALASAVAAGSANAGSSPSAASTGGSD